jgi:hypothetical protein
MDPVADGRAAHDVGRDGSDSRLRGGNVPLALSGHEQESHSPVVQYAGLRKPHEGAKIPSTSRRIATPRIDRIRQRYNGARQRLAQLS